MKLNDSKTNSARIQLQDKAELVGESLPETPFTRLTNLILGTNPKQRATINILLLTALVFIVLVYVMLYGSTENIFDTYHIKIVIISWITSTFVFYFIIRCGWNQGLSDKSLAMPQTLIAQTIITYSYAYTGAAHGCALILLALVMVFGMINMKVRSAYFACLYTIALIGFTMFYKSHTDPDIYPAKIEWIYFIIVATVLVAIAQLSAKLNYMRTKLKSQKIDLEIALANIQEMAIRDELTGLPNRRYLMELLNQHIERQARNGQEFYLAMVDLDHFKHINDTYGHAVGDEVLKTFTKFTCEQLRKTDIVSRWGGEEFLLLMPDSATDHAIAGLQRLHAGLVSFQVSATEPNLRITFSAGLTKYRQGDSVDAVIDRSDKLLYAAKSAGRNQTMQD